MSFTTFDALKSYAVANFEEDFQKLPNPRIYKIAHMQGCIRLYVGHSKVRGDIIPIWAHLGQTYDDLVLTAIKGFTMELGRSFHHNIQLHEPFCWLWPGINKDIGIGANPGFDKLNVFVRYVFMARGYPGLLEDMRFRTLQKIFPQICSDIVKGQDVNNVGSVQEDKRVTFDNSDSNDGENTEESLEETPDQEADIDVTFENRMQRLTDEFEAFKATLTADHEEQEAKKVETETAMRGRENDIEAAMDKIQGLEVELEAAQNEAAKWMQKYDKLKEFMRGVLEDAE